MVSAGWKVGGQVGAVVLDCRPCSDSCRLRGAWFRLPGGSRGLVRGDGEFGAGVVMQGAYAGGGQARCDPRRGWVGPWLG